MHLYRTTTGAFVLHKGEAFPVSRFSFDELLASHELRERLEAVVASEASVGDEAWLQRQELLAPVESQEVWAAGVTYLRSKDARMEESRESGGATFYDKVYEAERPELFFKSPGWRVIGPGGQVRVRKDSKWNVPEPELTLLISETGTITGYTIGNDMSSRDIEGENPLYLPQAKCYDGSTAIGPCIHVPEEPLSPDTLISITISRHGAPVYEGSTPISKMKRIHSELVSWLFRETAFPNGVFLMTGTCLVPGNDFTLSAGDVVAIRIDGVGTLVNYVR